MTTPGCIVLEYATSALDETGSPFVICFRGGENDNPAFRVYVLDDWIQLISPSNVFDRQYLEDFIYEVKQLPFADLDRVEQFFKSIERLSVGALRTAAVEAIDDSAPVLRHLSLDGHMRDVSVCDEQHFRDILADLPYLSIRPVSD